MSAVVANSSQSILSNYIVQNVTILLQYISTENHYTIHFPLLITILQLPSGQ